MAKKKKKALPPKRLRMKREGRLASAKTTFLPEYKGKNIVKGYKNWYGVDLLCAITELKMLGCEISEDYENNVKKTIENQRIAKEKRKKKQEHEEEELPTWQDENFFYIAGHTSGGFPYGVTWEEAREKKLIDSTEYSGEEDQEMDEDMPF
ncbi:MAG: hypothetical protein HQL32_09180 [Planctomycetes bacterium]|nr:hypothetical protein [Planctomycetota bacterium]